MATNDKYDRQLRLWGANGQRALGGTCVILVGASAAGTETLKNLVLPGVGSFLVVDDVAELSQQDIASNFFVVANNDGGEGGGDAKSTKKKRADVAAEYLQELNPDVQGKSYHVPDLEQADWKDIFATAQNATVTTENLLVVASDLDPNVLITLSQACIDHKLPLVVTQSYGLIGMVRLQVSGTVALLDPKPTNAPPDLRIKTSFPGLDKVSKSIDLASLEDHVHGHVPYPIILHQCLDEWKNTHDGSVPGSFDEKQEFKALIKAKSRDINKELNFEEAVQNSYLAYTERDLFVPENLDADSKLGKLFAALQEFQKQHNGRPPLNGSIPDMTANTDLYVQLQAIYKEQAAQDVKEMKALCQLGSGDENGSGRLSDVDVENFCANVYAVAQLTTRSLQEEYSGVNNTPASEELVDEWRMTLMDPYEVPEHTPIYWYLGLRACQVFCQEHGRYPGMVEKDGDDWESDVPKLQEIASQTILKQYGLEQDESMPATLPNICKELTRYANAEIHTVASVVGGVASQEAVKLITGQYIPLDNTYVFNGIVGVGGVYKF